MFIKTCFSIYFVVLLLTECYPPAQAGFLRSHHRYEVVFTVPDVQTVGKELFSLPPAAHSSLRVHCITSTLEGRSRPCLNCDPIQYATSNVSNTDPLALKLLTLKLLALKLITLKLLAPNSGAKGQPYGSTLTVRDASDPRIG